MTGDENRPVALVTGGLGAIGRAIRDALAARGYLPVAADLPAACEGAGGEVIELDVRSVDSCRAAVADVLADYKRLDVLVNNAGINARGATEEMPESIWQPVIDVNVGGTLRMCQAAFPALRDADRGAIVNLSSSAALVAIGGAAAYGISKAAISHLTKILALEWARHGIRVNAVAPTIVRSAMTADVLDDARYMREKLASIPLGRIATASDVARAVAWLAGPDSSMTTGISLPVDGGASLG